MREIDGRFVIEVGSDTVTHIIDVDGAQSESESRFTIGPRLSGEKICSRGHRYPGDRRVSSAECTARHTIDKDGFRDDAPGEIRSYCRSNARGAIGKAQDWASDDISEPFDVGYRLRWKQKGRARDEWHDIVVTQRRQW